MKKFGSDKPRKFAPSGKPKFSGGKTEFKPRKSYGDKPRDFSSAGERPYSDRRPGGFKPRPFEDREGAPSERPRYGSDRPKYGSDRPKFGGDKPRFGSERPKYGDKKLGFSGGKPRFGDDRPKFSSGDKPRHGSDRPKFGSDRPKFGGDKPRYGDERPAYGTDRPKYGGDRPGYASDRPKFGGDRPRYGSDRTTSEHPKFGGDRSRFDAGRPRLSDSKPAYKKNYDDSQKARDGRSSYEQRPRSNDDRPAYGEDRGGFERQGSKPEFRNSKFGAKAAPRSFGSDKPRFGGDKPRFGDKPKFGAKPGKFGSPKRDPYRVWKREEESEVAAVPALEKPKFQEAPDDADGVGFSEVGRRPSRLNREWVETAANNHPEITGSFSAAPPVKKLVVSLEDTRSVPIRLVWIFDTMVGDLPDGEPAAGDTVYVHDSKDKFLGSAIYNPNSRIRARIFSLDKVLFNQAYIREAIAKAVNLRKRLGFLDEASCRVIFGESDGIPGLVADKIGEILVIQPLTYAVDRQITFIVDQLNEQVGPDGIVVRTDVPIRAKEGLTVGEVATHGDIPERVQVKEEGYLLYANPASGQKTGMFLDQRKNRAVLKPFSEGARVLDLFCHVGGWAMRAAKYGASEVVGVDSSKPALELARAAATANSFEQVTFVESDVFDYFAETGADENDLFDIIICDPPAFAKTRAHFDEAIRAYLSLNYRAMKRLKPGGLLVTCSCSQAVSSDEFNDAILTAARNARAQFQVIERRGAPQDHPVLLGLPETDYLKCFVMLRTE